AYVRLLTAWNQRINLVGRTTIDDVWWRHILDSAQLLPHLPAAARRAVDLGSGAGLPGLVLAILGVPEVHLIESDRRKAVFLAEAIRITAAPAILHAERIERVAAFPVEVVTARACAPLPVLLDLAWPFLGSGTICLLPKGVSVAAELTAARKEWNMEVTMLSSVTDPQGTILRVEGVSRVERP
ncbi:MAG: 16S rRNA (guanine(527)-N(7))-methyltransferase RsmG, partial [Stellaceae bacterium]